MSGWRLAATAVVMSGLAFLVGGCVDDNRSASEDDATTGGPSVPATEQVPSLALELVPGQEPVLVATAIGDLEFTTLALPPERFVGDVAVTPFGLMIIDDSELMWSGDARTWFHVPVSTVAERITVVGDNVVVAGGGSASWLAWDGSGWTERAIVDVPGQVSRIVAGPRGAVAYDSSTVYHAGDGVTFTEARRGPLGDVFIAPAWVPEEDRDFGDCRRNFGATTNRIDGVLATDTGFVALTSAAGSDETCEPLLWFSPDGDMWELVSEVSPFGELSVVFVERGVAARDGRFVVRGEIGGQGVREIEPALWVSDDGLTWETAAGPADRIADVVAGALGWMLLGSVDAESGPTMAWFSADGIAWDGPHAFLPEGFSDRLPGWGPARHGIGVDAVISVGAVDGRTVLVLGRPADPEA